jgi:hypothetical protein
MKFVSISGTAVAVDDPRKVSEIWNEAWKVWFPGGKDDPTLTLLKVHVDRGEYWDNSGMSGIKYAIEAGKAYMSGTNPDVVGGFEGVWEGGGVSENKWCRKRRGRG